MGVQTYEPESLLVFFAVLLGSPSLNTLIRVGLVESVDFQIEQRARSVRSSLPVCHIFLACHLGCVLTPCSWEQEHSRLGPPYPFSCYLGPHL